MRSSFAHLISALVIAVLALALYSFLYWGIANASAEVAALEASIKAKTESTGRIAQARTALGQIAGDEALVQSYFVPEAGLVQFIEDMEARARAVDASIVVNSVETAQDDGQSVFVLDLKIRGSFDAVMRAMGVIEHAPHALIVSHLDLSRDENAWEGSVLIRAGALSASASPASTTTKSQGSTVPRLSYVP